MVAGYPAWIAAVSGQWDTAKSYVEALGVDNDLLHVIAGPVVQLLAVLILRSSFRRFAPWIVALLLELLNEWNDLIVETWPVRQIQYGEGLKDVILTMLLPTVALLMTRLYPHWFGMDQPTPVPQYQAPEEGADPAPATPAEN